MQDNMLMDKPIIATAALLLFLYTPTYYFSTNYNLLQTSSIFGKTITGTVNRSVEHIFWFHSGSHVIDQRLLPFINIETFVSNSTSRESPVNFQLEFDHYFDPNQRDHWVLPLENEFHGKKSYCASNIKHPKPSNDLVVIVKITSKSAESVLFGVSAVLNQHPFASDGDEFQTVVVTPSTPEFFQLTLDNKDSPYSFFKVEIEATDDKCMTASIIKAKCPVAYRPARRFQSMLQTITFTRTTPMYIEKDNLVNGDILQFQLHKNNQLCQTHWSDNDNDDNEAKEDISKAIRFKVVPIVTQPFNYFLPLACNFGPMAIISLAVWIFYFQLPRKDSSAESEPLISIENRESEVSNYGVNVDTHRSRVCQRNTSRNVYCSKASILANRRYNWRSYRASNFFKFKNQNSMPECQTFEPQKSEYLLGVYKKVVNIKVLSFKNPKTVNGLTPAQLLIFLQLLFRLLQNLVKLRSNFETGFKEDLCQLNYKCLFPLFGLFSFTHVLTSFWYVFWGIIFILIVIKSDKGSSTELFLSMGFGLVFIGVTFMMYQVCPQTKAFQFDVGVVYMVVLWCVVAVCPFRNANSNNGLIVWGNVELLFNGLLYFLCDEPSLYWIIMTVTHVLVLVVLTLHMDAYWKGFAWVLDFSSKRTPSELLQSIVQPFIQMHKGLLFYNVFNTCFAVLLWQTPYLKLTQWEVLDRCVAYLLVQTTVAVLLCILYNLVERKRNERFATKDVCLGITFLLGSFCAWLMTAVSFAAVDYKLQFTWTSLTPAESRLLNTDCIIKDFIDKDDLNSFCAALGTFFGLMALLKLAD